MHAFPHKSRIQTHSNEQLLAHMHTHETKYTDIHSYSHTHLQAYAGSHDSEYTLTLIRILFSVNAYKCVCVYKRILVYTVACVCICASRCSLELVCMHELCGNACMCICTFAWVCFVCIPACLYLCVRISVYACMCTAVSILMYSHV